MVVEVSAGTEMLRPSVVCCACRVELVAMWNDIVLIADIEVFVACAEHPGRHRITAFCNTSAAHSTPYGRRRDQTRSIRRQLDAAT